MSRRRRTAPPLVPVAEALALCDVARARRLDPPVRIDRQTLAEARARWAGRVLGHERGQQQQEQLT